MCTFEAWALQPSLITAQDAEARLPQAHRDYNADSVHTSIGRVPPDEIPRLWERNNKQGGGDGARWRWRRSRP